MNKHQAKIESLPTWKPTKEELKRIREGEEDIKHGRVTKAVDPRNKKDLRKVLGF